MQADQWPVVAIVGAGAVGCYFGGMLAGSGVRVTLIGRARHMETIARDGLLLEGLRVHERIPLAAMFEHAGISCRISEAIEEELWTKLVMNCVYNAISALTRARYGRMARFEPVRTLMQRVIAETVAVAHAEGVSLYEPTMVDAAFRLGEEMSRALSSTAQDIARGRPTEIDSLNGYVARRGAALGIATPVNDALYALVKLLEESATRRQG
jgi:2-dehydropantoate 2-reductase